MKHCVLVSVQNVTFQSQQVYCVSVCVICAWLVASFRAQWFVVYLLLSSSPFYLSGPWSASFSKQLVFIQLLYSTQITVDISYLQKKNMHQSLGELNIIYIF